MRVPWFVWILLKLIRDVTGSMVLGYLVSYAADSNHKASFPKNGVGYERPGHKL